MTRCRRSGPTRARARTRRVSLVVFPEDFLKMRSTRLLALLTLGWLAACAHTPPAPLVQPTVEVQSFVPVQLTPDGLQLQAVLQISNNMDDSVQFDRIDYGTELFDAPLARLQYGPFQETR